MSVQARDFSIFDVRLCYASEDEIWQKDFDKHLATLKRQGLGVDFYDCKAGGHWAIQPVGQKIVINLLLLSKEFLSSSCYDIAGQVLAMHQSDKAWRIIPVQLSFVDIKGDPLEALVNLPINPVASGPKPIAQWVDRDEAFYCVIEDVRRSLDEYIRRELICFARILSTLFIQYAPYWCVPYARSAVFTGRKDMLTQLHDNFHANRAAAPWKQAITGKGGVGKTELALEYVYRYGSEYQTVLWFQADSKDRLNSDLRCIAECLKLSGGEEEEDRQVSLSTVQQWLRDHPSWLLILDNVQQLSDLNEIIPADGHGDVLITTREEGIDQTVHPLELEEMEVDEGALLLLRRADILKAGSLASVSKDDRTQVRKIVRRLDKLPLALDLAGAYLEKTKIGLADYLRLYEQRYSQLPRRRGRRSRAYPDSVTTTFLLCFEQLKQKNAAAVELLQFCAFFHAGVIPEKLIRDADDPGPLLQSLTTHMAAFDDALEDLLNWSLIGYKPKTRDLSIHPLVQDVLQDMMDDATRRLWAERAIRALCKSFPNAEVEVWLTCQQYLPHALQCFAWIDRWKIATAEAAELFNRVGCYFYQRGDFARAGAYYQQAEKICEHALGPDHLITALTYHNWGALARSQQQYPLSRVDYEKALIIRQKVLGPHDPAIAHTFNGLGELYQTLGDDVRAESCYQQAFDIMRQRFGLNDQHVAACLSNLAGILSEWGQYQQAEQYYQQALAIQERVWGENGSPTIETLRNLAGLYRRMEKYREAEQFYEQALEIEKKKYGPRHRKVAGALNNFAVLYRDLGRYAEAEQMLKEARGIWEESLGPEHIDTSFALNNFATVYSARQEYDRAEPLYLKALAIREQTYVDSPDHPNIAQVLNNLGKDYLAQGRYNEAEPLLRRALAIYEKKWGPEHPDTVACRQNLAKLSNAQNQDGQAE